MTEVTNEREGRRKRTAGDTGDGSRLVTIRAEPFNAEAPLSALGDLYTPTPLFYVRSNFPLPEPAAGGWSLKVDGALDKPFELNLAELRAMPQREIDVTLECAGNDRRGYTPRADGEQWASGAISTGRWRGVELRLLLERASLRDSAVEILFEGADSGQPHGQPFEISFARSLPVEKALHPDTILALELNGDPLAPEHGAPARLLVAGWYGMASVKWLARISALERKFTGYYQRDRYIMEREGQDEPQPLGEMRVKSLITNPAPGARIALGSRLIEGAAWSGGSLIESVEVSIDCGAWLSARLLGEPQPYAWRRWELDWEPTPGPHTIRARATDAAGSVQPEAAEWNRLGYANNAVEELEVTVSEEE